MSFEEVLIQRLKEVQAATAIESVTKPRGRDAFDYGHACGLYEGIELALGTIEAILDEIDERERAS